MVLIWIGQNNLNIKKMKRTVLSILAGLLVLFLVGCGGIETKSYDTVEEMVKDAKSQVQIISPDELKAAIESEDAQFYLIDCRESNEFDTSCIKGAINIPRGLIEFKISNEAPKKRQDIYIYCDNGERSALAASILPYLKYSSVYVLESGFDNWQVKYPKLVEHHPQRGGSQTKTAAKPAGGCGG
jgi:rhodanese-related sulfurtransferase